VSAGRNSLPHTRVRAVPTTQIVASRRPVTAADTIDMNDFHIALLWLRSLEILIGHSPLLMMSELDFNDLFMRYRSPYKA
jgi:hypothetical protein